MQQDAQLIVSEVSAESLAALLPSTQEMVINTMQSFNFYAANVIVGFNLYFLLSQTKFGRAMTRFTSLDVVFSHICMEYFVCKS